MWVTSHAKRLYSFLSSTPSAVLSEPRCFDNWKKKRAVSGIPAKATRERAEAWSCAHQELLDETSFILLVTTAHAQILDVAALKYMSHIESFCCMAVDKLFNYSLHMKMKCKCIGKKKGAYLTCNRWTAIILHAEKLNLHINIKNIL